MATEVEERGIRDVLALTASNDSQQNRNPGALFRVNCTVAGNVAAVLESGNVEIIAVAVGYVCFPFRVVRVNTTNTTATATYANLYV